MKQFFLALLLVCMVACATTPSGSTQTIYAAGWTLVGATNSVADLHDAGTLKGADYDQAKAILAQASAAYKTAEGLATSGNTADAQAKIVALQAILNQLAAYLQAHGGK